MGQFVRPKGVAVDNESNVYVIDESVKWFLRSVYKGTIVYDDEIATEDIHGTHINNLRTYSFNDTLGRLKGIAFEKIYEQLDQENIMTINDKTDQYIIDLKALIVCEIFR